MPLENLLWKASGSPGELWKALESSGVFRVDLGSSEQALVGCRIIWDALDALQGSDKLWKALESSGRLRVALEGSECSGRLRNA